LLRLASKLFKKFITDALEACPPKEPIKFVKLDCKALAVDCTAGGALAGLVAAAAKALVDVAEAIDAGSKLADASAVIC
jgi:hypothetical protein